MKVKKLFLVLMLSFLSLTVYAAEGEIKESLDISTKESVKKSITEPLPPAAQIEVDFVQQLPDYCGEACFVMAAKRLGMDITQQDVHEASGLKRKRGCYTDDLVRAGLKLGVDADGYWIEDFKTSEEREYYLSVLKYFISLSYPVIISWNEDPNDHDYSSFEHFVLAVGYDDEKEEMTIMDPLLGPAEGRRIAYADFLDRWQWRKWGGAYGLVMYVIKGRVE
ncbi:MAG: C39 family peptidase [Deltaproteobacteria bacterium]|uniref:C39 family peptidase n=1 Tax=Candidatus Zymogenus saltonus TaxID=2844893 RepID=A0A9D8KGY2_9DELT|nr:C39 family peptidase [Candidatus Zymogenus saltonus]